MTNASGLALISVVDDDDSARESLHDLLEALGYAVQSFSSAEAFLRSSDMESTGCLLLDISMPGMDGVTLYEELRRQGVDIPVVFMTGHARESAMSEAQALGPCLFKPFTYTDLCAAIDSVMRDR